ncbi:MAG TPA: DUF5615 family PIN-like protein [Anaerolineales bacterium]|nr:DUF5615 family PIN-like protein [Anaerolineales bacterium]
MARLYANENFPRKVVQALRTLGHDVLTSHEAGKANLSIPDVEVLDFATEIERALLTINRRDFVVLHEQGIRHAGIIVCTQDLGIQGQAERIHQAISAYHSLSSQLIKVNRPQL